MVRRQVATSQPFPVNAIQLMTLSCSIHPLIQHQGPVVMKKSSPKTSYPMAKNVITTVIQESKNDYKLVKYIVSMQTYVQMDELSIQLHYIISNHYIYYISLYILEMNFIYQSKFQNQNVLLLINYMCKPTNMNLFHQKVNKVGKIITISMTKYSYGYIYILHLKMEKIIYV